MTWTQREIALETRSKGCHLVHSEITRKVPEIGDYKVGMANFFLKHTSASLMLNENCDPDVRTDMDVALDKMCPCHKEFLHMDEGEDDMPGHVKSGVIGVSLNIPISDGKLNVGVWQGIYLCEHRIDKHSRKVVVTLQGEKRKENQ